MESGITQPQPEDTQPNDASKVNAKSTILNSYMVRIGVLSIAGGVIAALSFFAVSKLALPGGKPSNINASVKKIPSAPVPKPFPTIKFTGTIEPDGGTNYCRFGLCSHRVNCSLQFWHFR